MTVAFLFPGQGPRAKACFISSRSTPRSHGRSSEASECPRPGYRVLSIMPVALRSTAAVQQALLIAGRATARALMAEHVHPACRRRHVDRCLWRGRRLRYALLCRCPAARPSARRADADGLPERLWPRRHRGPRRGPRGRHRGADPDRRVSGLRFQHQCAPPDRRRRERCGARLR